MGINEQIQKDLKDWYKQIDDYVNLMQGKKSKKKLKIPEPSPLIKRQVMFQQNYTCHKCGKMLPPTVHIHHKIHRSKGGTNSLDNLIALCPDCHAKYHYDEQLIDALRKQQKEYDEKEVEGYNPQKDIDDGMRRMGL